MLPQSANLTLTTPRFASIGELLIFGIAERCPFAGSPTVAAQWNRFMPHIGHIEGQIGNVAYGVIYNADESGSYDYLSGVAVTEFPAQPAGFTCLRIPAQRYAAFEHRGHVAEVAATWKAIWEHGLPAAGVKQAKGPAFERYDERFNAHSGSGGFEIWVPVG